MSGSLSARPTFLYSVVIGSDDHSPDRCIAVVCVFSRYGISGERVLGQLLFVANTTGYDALDPLNRSDRTLIRSVPQEEIWRVPHETHPETKA